jgi:hypothetical protein
VVDDVSPSKLATPKEREGFIERNLDWVSGGIETKFRLGQFENFAAFTTARIEAMTEQA